MNKKFKTKATYEDGFLKPTTPIELDSGEEVELIIIRDEKILDISGDISDSDLMDLASKNPSFDFLKDDEEDIYSINDLKKRYK